MSAELSPFDAARANVIKQMTPQLQKLATTIEQRLHRSSATQVMAAYDIGSIISQAAADRTKFGETPVELLSRYLNFEGGLSRLHELQRFADGYTRPWVTQQLEVPLFNQKPLNLQHFVYLLRVDGMAERQKLLTKVRQESMTSNTLLEYINATQVKTHQRFGGRRPEMPNSPIARVQKLYSLTHTVRRYSDEFLAAGLTEDLGEFFETLDEEAVPKAKETLDKAETAVNQMMTAARKVQKALVAARERFALFEDAGVESEEEPEAEPEDLDEDFQTPPPVKSKPAEKARKR